MARTIRRRRQGEWALSSPGAPARTQPSSPVRESTWAVAAPRRPAMHSRMPVPSHLANCAHKWRQCARAYRQRYHIADCLMRQHQCMQQRQDDDEDRHRKIQSVARVALSMIAQKQNIACAKFGARHSRGNVVQGIAASDDGLHRAGGIALARVPACARADGPQQ
eukprot:scaffold12284_cov136-Isochrysis_galbana.AAC.2